MNIFGSTSLALLQQSLNATYQKIQVNTENIANVDTPGYKAKYVTFEEELQRKLSDLSDGAKPSEVREAILSTQPQINVTTETERLDGNSVQLDAEEVELARNQLQYQYLTRLITDQYSRLQMAIESR